MHEIGLVSAAADHVLSRAGGQAVACVAIAIGPSVDPAVAEAAWRQAVAGTALAGATVSWTTAADELACFACGERYFGAPLDPCPDCGRNGLVVAPAPEVEVRQWRRAKSPTRWGPSPPAIPGRNP